MQGSDSRSFRSLRISNADSSGPGPGAIRVLLWRNNTNHEGHKGRHIISFPFLASCSSCPSWFIWELLITCARATLRAKADAPRDAEAAGPCGSGWTEPGILEPSLVRVAWTRWGGPALRWAEAPCVREQPAESFRAEGWSRAVAASLEAAWSRAEASSSLTAESFLEHASGSPYRCVPTAAAAGDSSGGRAPGWRTAAAAPTTRRRNARCLCGPHPYTSGSRRSLPAGPWACGRSGAGGRSRCAAGLASA